MGPGRPAAVLPRWELALYLLVSLGFHFYSFFRVYRDSREYEELLDEEFGLEPGSLLPGLKKDPTDFEWSFWMEWGRRRLGWLLLGHAALSQVSTLLAKQHRPWVLTAYGVWACWRALDTPGLALALLHVAVCLGIAQLRSPLLSWLCALLLLCSLRLDTAVDGKGGWPDGPQSERDLLRFSLTVRCLFCTAASLERGLCGAPLPWVLAYLFYYPTFHNGPVLSFPRFCAQMRCPQPLSPGARLALLVAGLGRLLCWWALAELLAQLMYTHALCASPTLLGTVSAWTLGGLALAQVHFFYVKYLVLFGVPALLMRLDGLVPPPQPRCVSTMFSFSGMWRYFDVGLHEFLIRAIAGADTMNPLLLEAVFPIIGQDREKWREEGTQRGGEKDRYLQTCVTTAHEASPLQVRVRARGRLPARAPGDAAVHGSDFLLRELLARRPGRPVVLGRPQLAGAVGRERRALAGGDPACAPGPGPSPVPSRPPPSACRPGLLLHLPAHSRQPGLPGRLRAGPGLLGPRVPAGLALGDALGAGLPVLLCPCGHRLGTDLRRPLNHQGGHGADRCPGLKVAIPVRPSTPVVLLKWGLCLPAPIRGVGCREVVGTGFLSNKAQPSCSWAEDTRGLAVGDLDTWRGRKGTVTVSRC